MRGPKPLIRYWLTSAKDDQFDAKIANICAISREAPALAAAEPGSVSERSDAPDRGPLHAEALFVAQPDGDLAEYSGAQVGYPLGGYQWRTPTERHCGKSVLRQTQCFRI